jgi:hypothetical protein
MNSTNLIRRTFEAAWRALPLAVVSLACGTSRADLVGLWEFDDSANIGRATVGTNLTIAGTAPTWFASQTYVGNTLTGVIQTAVGIPNHLIATHGIAPNGGGSKVNQYSMVFDIRRPNTNEWRTLFQTDASNATDGEYFVRDSDARLGVGTLQYTPNYTMPADTWARVVLTSDLAANVYRTYVDGVLQHNHTAVNVLDGRHALDPTVLLFGDEDNENGLLSVGVVGIWNRTLSDAEVTNLGVAGTIIAIPEPGSLLLVGSVLVSSWIAVRRRSAKSA